MKYTQPVNPFSSATRSPEKLNPLSMLRQIWSNTVEATLWTFADYAWDVTKSAVDGVRNLWWLASIDAYKSHGLLNIPKSIVWAVSREVTAVKDATLWIIDGVEKFYKHGIQDNISDLSSATVDHVPVVWPLVWNMVKTIASIPALAWSIPRFLKKNISDKPLDLINTKTASSGRDIPKRLLRV